MGLERTSEGEARGGKPFVPMLIAGTIASALGVALALAIDWFPVQGSKQAEKIDTFWDVLLICSVPVFVLVSTVVVFAVLRFRMRPGEESLDGPPIHGNTRLEVVWTALPAIMLVSLCTYAYVVLVDIEEAPAGQERKVVVTGEQFTWTFEYNEDGKKFRNSQLYVPQGESVKFLIKSKDVIHDFWVPAWRMKIDAVPGLTTDYRITPKRLGNYPVVCAELCGLGHAFMRQTAHVLTKAKFAEWVAKQGAPAGGAAAGGGQAAAVDAKKLFLEGNAAGATACGSCHTLADAGSSGQIGPDLGQVLRGQDPAEIREDIVKPDAEVAPGFGGGIMPSNYAELLSASELDALVSYLAKVTK
jgi:cytochrome c oxidase subunit 2